MSARCPLLPLPFTGNTSLYAANSAMKGGHGQRNGTTLCLLTNPASVCNIPMGGVGFLCRTPPVLSVGTLNNQHYLFEVLEPVASHTFRACHQQYSNRMMRDHAMFKSSSLPIRLNCFLGLVFTIYRVVDSCTMTLPGYTTRCYTRSDLAICRSRMVCLYTRNTFKASFKSLVRRVVAIIANNGGCTTTDFVIIHLSQEAAILIV
ncbi:hypothetical protein TNCV_3005031 [Trichonephila clavipes]|nr:hypothetical protein TNCV_3005031 [Trichonephila clavipes]